MAEEDGAALEDQLEEEEEDDQEELLLLLGSLQVLLLLLLVLVWVLVLVVEGSSQVEEVLGGSQVKVGGVHSGVDEVLGGVHSEDEVVGSLPPEPLPSLNHHVPVRTPSLSGAKNVNKPRDKSRPP